MGVSPSPGGLATTIGSLLTRAVWWCANHLFTISVALRVTLIAYSEWHDAHLPVRFTDADFFVFSDAARHVWSGGSPYARATYRYPPLFAWLLVPGSALNSSWWGKAVFCSADLAVGALTVAVLRRQGVDAQHARACAAAFLLSPLAVVTSSRGSADAVACALILALLLSLQPPLGGGRVGYRRSLTGGTLLGIAVHARVFPVIYALPCALALGPELPERGVGVCCRFVRAATAPRRIVFGAAAAAALCACAGASAWLYGWDALQEGLLYHASRVDVRHNFSVRWLLTYLGLSGGGGGRAGGEPWPAFLALAALRAAPAAVQLGAVAGVGAACVHNLPLAFFLQTLAFVALNGVVTAQYFNWWLALLPLVLPHSELPWPAGIALAAGWLAAELHWLWWAYALEMLGEAVHAQLAGAAAMFAVANITVGVVVAVFHRHGAASCNGDGGSGPHVR